MARISIPAALRYIAKTESGPLQALADAIGVSRTTLWRYRNEPGTAYLSALHRDRFIETYPGYRK